MPDVKARAQDMVDRAKGAVGRGDPPLATEVGGRVEAVREALQAFGQGDMDRFLSVFSDDAEWVAPKGENFPGSGTHQGREAIKEKFTATVGRSYASFGFRPEHYLQTEKEEIVVVLGIFEGEGMKGKGTLDAPSAQVWEFEGNRVARLRIFADSAGFPGIVDEDEERELDEKQREQEKKESEGDQDEGGGSKGDGDEAKGGAGEGREAPGGEAKGGEGKGREAPGGEAKGGEGKGGEAEGDSDREDGTR